MSILNIDGVTNFGPVESGFSVTFEGYVNGIIKLIDNNGSVIASSDQYSHQNVLVTLVVRHQVQISAIVEGTNPAFHGTVTFSGNQSSFSNTDILQSWKQKYRAIRVYKINSEIGRAH